MLGTIKDIEFIGGRRGGWVVDFGFDVVWLNAHAAQIFVCFLLLPRVTHFFKLPHRKSFLLSCRHNKSTRRLQEIEKRFNIRVLSVRSLCASLFYNVLKKALISCVYPLSFGETTFLMKIDHKNSLADIASISVALRADSVTVVSGIGNCALGSKITGHFAPVT